MKIAAKAWILALAGLGCALPALAQGPQEWVLSLTWTPEYCKANPGSKEPQCQEERYFDLGGLLPRFVAGTEPECSKDGLDPELLSRAMLTLPNKEQLRRIWRKQGACSGLAAGEYLVQLDRAARRVSVPAIYREVRGKTATATTVTELKEAFIRDNEGLTPDAMVLRCRSRNLHELQFCIDADFAFQRCDVDLADACRDPVQLRPVRAHLIRRGE
ncbi:MAG TPA: hypothetical protein VLI06_00050 [Solimonas sp.]|nr:hypothetical protein [Solimonas sp.]